MNRRSFLTTLAGVLIAVRLPAPTIRRVVGYEHLQKSVTGRLTIAFNEYMKGSGSAHMPKGIIVGSDLMEAFEGEQQALTRFVDAEVERQGFKTLKFKSVTMWSEGPGWHYKFVTYTPPIG